MRVAYLDCNSGISGDMVLGALVDTGVSLEAIQRGVDSLGLPSCTLEATEVRKHGFRATQVTVNFAPEHKHRHLHDIIAMIDGSDLTKRQKELSRAIFQRLGAAEAKVHGTSIEKVHFHEVGAVDSIADIVGAAIGWDLLGVDRITCSAIPTGTGSVQIAHGRVSVPAPATAELLTGIPLAASDIEAELTTPTGAAIAGQLVDQFGPMPSMSVAAIGIGAGTRDLETQPNVLRLLVGTMTDETVSDTVYVLETNLDDTSGEWIGYCQEQLAAAGALDVYLTPIQMKKNRPAVVLGVLCQASDVATMERIIFRETGTLGIRRWSVKRTTLQRRPRTVTTPWGDVQGKVARLPDGQLGFAPEFESCRSLAATSEQPLRAIYRAAQQAFDRLPAHDQW